MTAILTLIARLREPSTMAAIGVLIALFGGAAGLNDGLSQIIGGVAAVLGVLLPEAGSPVTQGGSGILAKLGFGRP